GDGDEAVHVVVAERVLALAADARVGGALVAVDAVGAGRARPARARAARAGARPGAGAGAARVGAGTRAGAGAGARARSLIEPAAFAPLRAARRRAVLHARRRGAPDPGRPFRVVVVVGDVERRPAASA